MLRRICFNQNQLLPKSKCARVEDSGKDDEQGNAIVEFILLTIVLLIPLVYVILSLSIVQANVFAGEAASREAARILAREPENIGAAMTQIRYAFEDYDLPVPTDVEVMCIPTNCRGDDAIVHVGVNTTMRLPLIPSWAEQMGSIVISSASESVIDGIHVGR